MEVDPDVDRLSIHPNGRLLYVPTWEGGSADYINVLDADSGDVIRRVYFSNRSHYTQFPLSGPLFQETKATDGSGHYVYMVDPSSYAVSRIVPYSGILGPYAVDGMSRHVVNKMQVADIKTGRIVLRIFQIIRQESPGCYTESGGLRTKAKSGKAAATVIHTYTSGACWIRWLRT